jgi:hypothetical protein
MQLKSGSATVPAASVGVPPTDSSGAGWEVKIGCDQASSTVKRRFGTVKWLANPGDGKMIAKTAKNSSSTP